MLKVSPGSAATNWIASGFLDNVQLQFLLLFEGDR
jgi:hypothetical protein